MRELNQNELTAIAGGDLEDDIRTMSASWGAAGGVLGSIAGTISNILGRQDENKPSIGGGFSGLVIPHIFDHMDIPRTMSSSRRIPFQITSFPGGLSFFLAR